MSETQSSIHNYKLISCAKINPEKRIIQGRYWGNNHAPFNTNFTLRYKNLFWSEDDGFFRVCHFAPITEGEKPWPACSKRLTPEQIEDGIRFTSLVNSFAKSELQGIINQNSLNQENMD